MGDINGDFKGTGTKQLHLGDGLILEQLVAHHLRIFAQNMTGEITVQNQGNDGPAPDRYCYGRFFRINGKRGDPVYFVFYIQGQLLQVRSRHRLHPNSTAALNCGAGSLFNSFQGRNSLFHGQDDAFGHLFGTGSGVGNPDDHFVQIKFRKDLLLDLGSPV